MVPYFWTQWVEWIAKVIGALGGGAGVLIAAIGYRSQTQSTAAEWVK